RINARAQIAKMLFKMKRIVVKPHLRNDDTARTVGRQRKISVSRSKDDAFAIVASEVKYRLHTGGPEPRPHIAHPQLTTFESVSQQVEIVENDDIAPRESLLDQLQKRPFKRFVWRVAGSAE